MTNVELLSAAISEWMFKVAASVLPKVTIPTESPVGKFMYGFIGVNPASYNIWHELGFLAEPTIEVFVAPLINRYLGRLSDDQIKSVAIKYVDAIIAEVEKKGSINLFGIELQKDAFYDLKKIVTAKLGE